MARPTGPNESPNVPSPVQTEPGVLVLPVADQQLAVAHWLACAPAPR